MSTLDKKGIFSFLLITFAITYGVEFTLIAGGISPIMQGLGSPNWEMSYFKSLFFGENISIPKIQDT